MKKFIITMFVVFVLSGCTSGENLDGKYLTDGEGNFYLVDHRIFDTYFLRDVDEEEIKKLNSFTENK